MRIAASQHADLGVCVCVRVCVCLPAQALPPLGGAGGGVPPIDGRTPRLTYSGTLALPCLA